MVELGKAQCNFKREYVDYNKTSIRFHLIFQGQTEFSVNAHLSVQ